jgi:16S rRNA processing protein RimM
MASEWLPFGILGRPHGRNGEILLHPHNVHGVERRDFVLPSLVRLSDRELEVASSRPVPEGYLLRFCGVEDRESAVALAGQEVLLLRQSLCPLGAGEFFVQDLVGCEAVDAAGRALGRVRGTYWNGAQDVMVVVGEDGGERLLPVVAEHVLGFDGARRRVVVDPHD